MAADLVVDEALVAVTQAVAPLEVIQAAAHPVEAVTAVVSSLLLFRYYGANQIVTNVY